MATLNLKDRVIETKIAYVGASFGGKSTNLERLHASPEEARCGKQQEEGGVTWFDWRPLNLGKFDDCEVSVRVIAPSGSDVAQVASADGVVLVVDSDPAALDRNRRAVGALRDELGTREVPVVVQLNKRDLPEALSEEQLIAALEIETWPRVSANAESGEGVVETMRKAVEGVLAVMKEASHPSTTPTAIPNGHGHATEANPLLAALRSVIEAAIAEQMRQLEARLESRFLEAVDRRLAEFAAVNRDVSDVRREVVDGRKEVVDVRREASEARKDVALLRREVANVGQRLETMATLQQRACTKDDLVLESGRRAIAVDSAQAKQKDQILASLGAFQRTIDAAFADQRKLDQQTSAKVSALVTESCDAVLAAMSPISVGITKLARIEDQTAHTAAWIDEMSEQLEKRKKGWFG